MLSWQPAQYPGPSANTFLQRSIGAALEGYGLPVLKAGTTQRVAYAIHRGPGDDRV